MAKPAATIFYKGWGIALFFNHRDGKDMTISFTIPEKRYDKNKTWMRENKHLKAEWVNTKYWSEYEGDSLVTAIKMAQDKAAELLGRSSPDNVLFEKDAAETVPTTDFNDDDIPF